VAVNCAAIPETLIESELFGHEKGAFTGAVASRQGKFESASGGSLFLDEVADLSPGAQAKLLRVIQEGRVERLGSGQSTAVNVRVLAATNKNLETECSAGRFREDLFFRLNVIPLALPPLRERNGDVLILLEAFLKELKTELYFDDEIKALLLAYRWPGNIRELRNLAERIVVMRPPGGNMGAEDLRGLLMLKTGGGKTKTSFEDLRNSLDMNYNSSKEAYERLYLTHQLRKNGGSLAGTAESTGLSLGSLTAKFKKHGIRP
jgi:two-component system nitrogen regulation response regulator NtrX